ncbi:MAG: carboxymuconolactone decarboxylase family protein [Phycisphaerales bacterium]
MPRIAPLTVESASPAGAEILTAIKGKIGMVPNIYATMAHSPAALGAALAFGDALGKSSLSPAIREQLALVIAGTNSCDYCASAHTAIGKGAGVDADELADNLTGKASDPKVQGALTFAKQVVEQRGHVSDAGLQAARDAGLNEGEIIEVIAVVAINTFTNYFNHIADPDIDFPVVRTPAAVS